MGYQIGRGLIKPQSKKIEAIQKAAQPINKTKVLVFLGFAGHYRCFIPNFSSIASPLTDLSKKGQPEKLKWSMEAETAFQMLKCALSSSFVLHSPDFGCPFILLPVPAWVQSCHKLRGKKSGCSFTSVRSALQL